MIQGIPWWSSGKDCDPTAKGLHLIPGQGTKIPEAMQCTQKTKN